MKFLIKSSFILFVALAISLFAAESETYPIYLRLRFDEGSNLWERKVLPDDTCWAEQSYDNKTWNSIPELPRKIKIGVALGGGGVCGIVHIGVLKAFEENNIPIHGIAGTSMGAIIGGLYACGYSSDELESVVNSIDWSNIFSERPPRQYLPIWEILREKPREPGVTFNLVWDLKKPFLKKLFPSLKSDPRGGLREAQKFTDEIAQRTLGPEYRAGFDFDSLTFPYGAILTNLQTGKITFKRKGTVSTAARASASVPIAFEPMNIADTQYVDGAVLDDLPVDAFIPFDTSRAPNNPMEYIGEDKINYVIAVSPFKRRGERNKVEGKPEVYGLFGIKVKGKSANLAREIYVWDNWDRAHARIDVEVSGFFEFHQKKIEEMVRKGYDGAWKEIYHIKTDLAIMEDSSHLFEENQTIDTLNALKRIHRLTSITLFSLIRDYEFNLGDWSFVFQTAISEIDSINGSKKYFFLLSDNPIKIKNDTCYIKFEFRPLDEKDFEKYFLTSKKNKTNRISQNDIIQTMKETILSAINSSETKTKIINENSEIAIIRKHLCKYTERGIEEIKDQEEKRRLLKAIRYKEGSYFEKQDICDALKRIYNLGDFEDVIAKIEKIDKNWAIKFFLKQKKICKKPVNVILKMDCHSTVDNSILKEADKIIRKSVQDTISKKKRMLNFNEIKETVETNLVKQGFVAPNVDNTSMKNNVLSISGNMGTYLNGTIIRGDFNKANILKIKKEFEKPYNPRNILKSTKYIFKEFQLKTISVEGIKDDSLIIAAREKTNTTLEYPSITIEGFEGINSFGELRVRRWNVMNIFSTSPYANYSFNYVMKDAEELPRGQSFGVGLDKCSNKFLDFPEIRGYWRHLKYPSVQKSQMYDMEFEEKNVQLIYPIYLRNFAIIPGYEISKFSINDEWSETNQEGVLWLRYDALDRIIFPESGLKFDIDAKFGYMPLKWSRARARLVWVPVKMRLQDKVTTTITTRLFLSKYSANTPQHERYSLGGFSPIGSYCMRLYDSEDLPGYRKDEFREPEMWKALISWRFTLMEIAPMGLRFNIQMESFMYIAGAGKHVSINKRLEECPGFGLYFDTSYLNIGLIALFHKETYRHEEAKYLSHLMSHFHFSVVYYGFAL